MVDMKKIYRLVSLVFILSLGSACAKTPELPPSPSIPPTFTAQQQTLTITPRSPTIESSKSETPFANHPAESQDSSQTLRFAVVGDYGEGNQAEKDVAELISSWNPDLIITTGDNNYPNGAEDTIDVHVGQFFHTYIFPYAGGYGVGATENRFFPSLGNHDWITDNAKPYLEYFSLPGNERYYQFNQGPVDFFVLDSDAHEPDGVNSSSIQADWLKEQLSVSSATWKVVYFHHPPYSSGLHGSTNWMRWPFKDWGVNLVISGHDHTYERLMIDGLTYIVNGLGGGSIYDFFDPIPGSQVRYNQDYGAMLIEADQENLRLRFFDRSGDQIDDLTLTVK